MKSSTEATFRAIIGTDAGVDPALVDQALSILKDSHDETAELTSVIRIKDVCGMLGVSKKTLQKYLNAGLLERVYGGGKWTLGISMKSYIRFTENRPSKIDKAKPAPLPRPSRRAAMHQAREVAKRKIAWALRSTSSAPRLQRYLAIESYLAAHPEHTYYLICEAVGIPDRSYATFKRTSKRGVTKYAMRRSEILRLIQAMVPDKSVPVNARNLTRRMNKLHHNFSNSTVGRVLKANGYKILSRSNDHSYPATVL